MALEVSTKWLEENLQPLYLDTMSTDINLIVHKINKRISELKELAHRFRHIDNYDEIARMRELQMLQKFIEKEVK